MIDEHPFALCLTHDVDRPYKRPHHALYFGLRDRSLRHLKAIVPGHNPYWTFEDIVRLERHLGVRSAFYFLNEQPLASKTPSAWMRPDEWIEELGRYHLESPPLRGLIQNLDAGGWEVGLHGSYDSFDDRERLGEEKAALEAVRGGPVCGGRQHHLRLDGIDTWCHHVDVGLRYDASAGTSSAYGFTYGYLPFRPFGDDFVVFPLTVMECALPDPADSFDAAWAACRDLVDEAAANDAVMTVLWHPRFFSTADFPGYRRLYTRLVTEALDRGAWVGSPGQLYDSIDVNDLPSGVAPLGSPPDGPLAAPGNRRP